MAYQGSLELLDLPTDNAHAAPAPSYSHCKIRSCLGLGGKLLMVLQMLLLLFAGVFLVNPVIVVGHERVHHGAAGGKRQLERDVHWQGYQLEESNLHRHCHSEGKLQT